MGRAATADDFRKLKERRTKRIPAYGIFGDEVDEVCIQSLTERERGEVARKIYESNKDGVYSIDQERPWIVIYGVTDESGNRLFTEHDIEWLMDLHSGAIGLIYDEIDKLCGVSIAKEESRIEELAKN